jgi:hypothetical protein
MRTTANSSTATHKPQLVSNYSVTDGLAIVVWRSSGHNQTSEYSAFDITSNWSQCRESCCAHPDAEL